MLFFSTIFKQLLTSMKLFRRLLYFTKFKHERTMVTT